MKHTRHVKLSGYETLYTSGSNQKYSSHGQICFIKNSIINNFTLLAHNANRLTFESTNMLELSLFEYMMPTKKEIYYICLLYKHPQMKNSEFAYEFDDFISKHFRINEKNRIDKNLFILGDFNIDFNNKKKMMNYMASEFGLFPTFSKTKTHDSGSQIDWCFTNVKLQNNSVYESKVYESWFSDHKPIWLQIGK